MTLPASGSISLGEVNTEFGRSATAAISLNDTDVRTLFAKSSGANSLLDGRGKSYYRIGTGTVVRDGGGTMSAVITTVRGAQPFAQISLQLFYTTSGQSLGTTVVGNCDASGNFDLYQGISGSDPYWFPAPLSNAFWVLQDTTHNIGGGNVITSS